MKTLLTTFIISATLFSVKASEVKFKAGSQFEAVNLRGQVGVWCNDGRGLQHRVVYCRANMLSPSEFSRALYEGGEDIDEMKLSVTHGNGKRVTKSSKVKDSQSTKSFNLWVGTLFQRPLLDYGHNQVEYALTKGGSLVGAGTFDVTVDSLPDRNCAYRTYTTSSCNSLSICNHYFADENYCE